jgi:hypothetical protein
MDKKEAEDEALRKAKQTQNAAGKNTGMSGRDLVRYYVICPAHSLVTNITRTPLHSSNTIPSGSRKKTTATIRTIGI